MKENGYKLFDLVTYVFKYGHIYIKSNVRLVLKDVKINHQSILKMLINIKSWKGICHDINVKMMLIAIVN